eukprot:UN32802
MYISLMEAFASVERLPHLLDEMKHKNIKLNGQAYSQLIHIYGKINNVDKALEYFNEMKKTFTPDGLACLRILNACKQSKEWNRALELLNEFKEKQYDLNIRHYNVILAVLGHSGNLSKAEEMYDLIYKNCTITDSGYTDKIMLDIYAHYDLEKCEKLFREKLSNCSESFNIYLKSFHNFNKENLLIETYQKHKQFH